MAINLKALIADCEAGTDGPWALEALPNCRDGVTYTMVSGSDGSYVVDVDDWSFLTISPATASRIARLPDLEAAYIEAVEMLMNARGWLYEEWPDCAADIDTVLPADCK